MKPFIALAFTSALVLQGCAFAPGQYLDPDEFKEGAEAEHGTVQLIRITPEMLKGDLASDAGSLVFTGADIDPETVGTLRRMGFRDPEKAAETVRGWHFGRRPAVTSARAREVLTELTPALLAALGGAADPDGALDRLDAAHPGHVALHDMGVQFDRRRGQFRHAPREAVEPGLIGRRQRQ